MIICSEQIWSNCKYRTNITKYQNSILGSAALLRYKCENALPKCMFHVVFPDVTKNETDLPNHSAVWNKMIQCLHKRESTYVTDTIRFHLECEPGFRKSWNDQFPPDASTQPVLFSGVLFWLLARIINAQCPLASVRKALGWSLVPNSFLTHRVTSLKGWILHETTILALI